LSGCDGTNYVFTSLFALQCGIRRVVLACGAVAFTAKLLHALHVHMVSVHYHVSENRTDNIVLDGLVTISILNIKRVQRVQ
jgi:hypothetical protein